MNFKKIADTSFKEESKLLPKGFTHTVLHILMKPLGETINA